MPVHLRIIEVILATYWLVVGFLFAATDTLFREAYIPMVAFAPPEVWALILVSISCLHMFSLWLNGKVPKVSSTIRTTACVSHAVLLGSISVCFFVANHIWPIITMITILAIVGVLMYSNLTIAKHQHG